MSYLPLLIIYQIQIQSFFYSCWRNSSLIDHVFRGIAVPIVRVGGCWLWVVHLSYNSSCSVWCWVSTFDISSMFQLLWKWYLFIVPVPLYVQYMTHEIAKVSFWVTAIRGISQSNGNYLVKPLSSSRNMTLYWIINKVFPNLIYLWRKISKHRFKFRIILLLNWLPS